MGGCVTQNEFESSDSVLSIGIAQINYENNQQDALYRLIYYSKSALHVSSDIFAHHQEHLTIYSS